MRRSTRLLVASVVTAAVILAVGMVVASACTPRDHPTNGGKTAEADEVAAGRDASGESPSGRVRLAPPNCPACAMGLTAEWVFKRLDRDGNRKVTVTEFQQSPGIDDGTEAKEAVGRMDTNKDGTLSWEEFAAAYKLRHAKCTKAGPAGKAPNLRPDGRGNGSRFAQVFILRNDRNGDGAVDKSEFRGAAWRFDQMDKNRNGQIDPEELEELHTSRMNDPKSMRERLRDGDVRKPPERLKPRPFGRP